MSRVLVRNETSVFRVGSRNEADEAAAFQPLPPPSLCFGRSIGEKVVHHQSDPWQPCAQQSHCEALGRSVGAFVRPAASASGLLQAGDTRDRGRIDVGRTSTCAWLSGPMSAHSTRKFEVVQRKTPEGASEAIRDSWAGVRRAARGYRGISISRNFRSVGDGKTGGTRCAVGRFSRPGSSLFATVKLLLEWGRQTFVRARRRDAT